MRVVEGASGTSHRGTEKQRRRQGWYGGEWKLFQTKVRGFIQR